MSLVPYVPSLPWTAKSYVATTRLPVQRRFSGMRVGRQEVRDGGSVRGVSAIGPRRPRPSLSWTGHVPHVPRIRGRRWSTTT